MIHTEDHGDHKHTVAGNIDINEIRKQIQDGEGCKIQGYIEINKVPGNFHISGHAMGQQLLQIYNNQIFKMDMSH